MRLIFVEGFEGELGAAWKCFVIGLGKVWRIFFSLEFADGNVVWDCIAVVESWLYLKRLIGDI